MASTMIVLRRSMVERSEPLTTRPKPSSAGHFFFAGSGFRRRAPVFFQLIVEGFQTDSQNFRGTRLIVAGGLERFQDQHFLGFFDRRAYAQADGVGVVGCGTQRGLTETRRQVLGLHHAGVADDHGALERIAQFAHISRPGVVVELVEYGLADCRHFAAMLLAHFRKQKLNQGRNVFLVFPQRRHVNIEDIEAVVEIAAQFASRHGLVGNLIRGREHADIDRSLHFASQAAQFAILQNAQQLGLRSDRHLADLIEQERSAFGQLKAACPPFQRARECAFLVAEDLALHQGFGDGGAVDGDEWPILCAG